jgi:hypothetical protein
VSELSVGEVFDTFFEDGQPYDASDIKPRRARRTKAELVEFNRELYRIVEANQPVSDRNVYYRAVSAGLIDKDTAATKRRNYQKVIRAIGGMRESGEMPFGWIVDNTRLRRGPRLHDSMGDALADMTRLYRRNLWRTQSTHVEVWCESDSAASEVVDVTWGLGVSLMSCRGQSSSTFAWTAVQDWRQLDKNVIAIYVGDWDPSGLAIARSLEERLKRYGPELDIEFQRLAIEPEDIENEELKLREFAHETNRADPNYKAFVTTCQEHGFDPDESIELEAVEAPTLRAWVRDIISECIDDKEQWEMAEKIEEEERKSLSAIVDSLPREA